MLIQAPRLRRLLKVGTVGPEILEWAVMMHDVQLYNGGLPTDHLLFFFIFSDDKDKGEKGARVYALLPPRSLQSFTKFPI